MLMVVMSDIFIVVDGVESQFGILDGDDESER